MITPFDIKNGKCVVCLYFEEGIRSILQFDDMVHSIALFNLHCHSLPFVNALISSSSGSPKS